MKLPANAAMKQFKIDSNDFFDNLKNPLAGPIRFELRPQIKKDTSQRPQYGPTFTKGGQ